MTEVTFIQDYYAAGRLQMPEGAKRTIYPGEVIPIEDGFLDMYELYGLEKRGIVTLNDL